MMRINRKVLILLAGLTAAFVARAEDIDLFSGIQANGPKPNLMVLMDNSAHTDSSADFSCPEIPAMSSKDLDTVFGFETCGLYKAIKSISDSQSLVGNINMGLMLFNYTQAHYGSSSNGGALKVPSTSPYTLPTMTSSVINDFLTTISSLSLTTDKSNNSVPSQGMQEVWAYYKGATGESGMAYDQHFTNACQRNFVVYISDATRSNPPVEPGNPDMLAALGDAGATSAQKQSINISSNDKYESNWADEWARFMFKADMSPDDITGNLKGLQNIITYTIIITDESNPDYVQLMTSMAELGGGKAIGVSNGDLEGFTQALLQIFNEVQGVNTAFASASLPVNANAQGTNLNQVFLGVFRPDVNPRWSGNLKQYQLGVDPNNSDEVILVDFDEKGPKDAISSAGTGFISPNAVSCWTSKNTATVPDALFDSTNSSSGGFWWQNPQGASDGYDLADGEVVEKGGVHQRIRLDNLKHDYSSGSSNDSRKLYTCTSGCASGSSLSATPFALSNNSITASLLGSSAPAISISSIARDDTTQRATVTLASTPNPALFSGQTVTLSGSVNSVYNGTFSITVLDATHFTIPLGASVLTPPTSTTGSYSLTAPATTAEISSITRSGTTATVTTAAAHGFSGLTPVTITGASQGYNGDVEIVVTGTNTFTYTVTESPSAPTSGGTATKGTESFMFASTDIVVTSLSATTKNVTVTNSDNGSTPPKTWVAGNSVTISGVASTPANFYNQTWTITNVGLSCTGGTKNKSFCFTISTTPASPATALDASGMTASTTGSSNALSSIGRGSTTCAVDSSYGSSGSATATATAVAASALPASSGTAIFNISGVPATNEDNYLRSGATITITSSTTFTYPVTVAPACREITSGMQATPSGVDRDTLIRWVRGEDNAGDESGPDSSFNKVNIRPSVHGDVLHSRPAVVNYGGSIGVVVFYGSNDGVFRAINGNQTNPEDSTLPSPGNELWGFIPQEFFSRLSRQRNNSPQVKISTTPTSITPTPLPKDYFFDGSAGVYKTASGNVYLFITARRGGRVIYALDVTDPLTPKFMWKHSNTDTDFTELGQTWSQPRAMKVKGHSNPVVVFGAGYDPAEDTQPAGTDTMGRGVFVLDALDGTIVWQARQDSATTSTTSCTGNPCLLRDMTYAIPSDVAPVDRDFDGYADRIYVPDLGGNVWRIDLEPSTTEYATDDWQVELLASVGGTGSGDKRKIFFPPAVVASTNYDAVVFATGDREHPLASDAAVNIANRFYMIKDLNQGKDGSKNADGTALTPVSDLSSNTVFTSTADLFDSTSQSYDLSLKGFYINLISSGEKAVNKPLIVGSTVYFATNAPVAPDANTCVNLGQATAYQVDWFTGGPANKVVLEGGGMPPSPVEAIVLIDGKYRDVIIGGGVGTQGAKSALGGGSNPNAPVSTRKRSFWYEKR